MFVCVVVDVCLKFCRLEECEAPLGFLERRMGLKSGSVSQCLCWAVCVIERKKQVLHVCVFSVTAGLGDGAAVGFADTQPRITHEK